MLLDQGWNDIAVVESRALSYLAISRVMPSP